MDLKNQLKTAGLNDNETDIYLYLLQEGQSTPPQIAKGTGIARTNTYHILRALKERGLIRQEAPHRRKAYLAADPGALMLNWERQKIDPERMLPDLRALYTTNKNKPGVTFYNGFDQVKEIYLASFEATKIYGLGSTGQLSTLDKHFLKYYFDEIKKRNIVLYDILTNASKEVGGPMGKEILKGLYDFKFLPEKYHDQPTDLLIWDNKIALITLEVPIFGTIITSPLLANTFKMIFEILWEKL